MKVRPSTGADAEAATMDDRPLKVPLAGENVLQHYDDYAHGQIIRASQLNVDGSLENVGTTGKMILIFPVHPKNTLQGTLLSIQR